MTHAKQERLELYKTASISSRNDEKSFLGPRVSASTRASEPSVTPPGMASSARGSVDAAVCRPQGVGTRSGLDDFAFFSKKCN